MNANLTRRCRGAAPLLLAMALLSVLPGCRPANPFLPAPGRPVAVREGAGQELYERWRRALVSDDGPLDLVATEEELTSLAALSLNDTPVQEVSVWLTPRGVHLRATVFWAGRHTLEAWLGLEQPTPTPRLTVQHVGLDGRSLPRFARLSIQQAVNDALADASLSITLEQVTFGEGWMHIVAHPK